MSQNIIDWLFLKYVKGRFFSSVLSEQESVSDSAYWTEDLMCKIAFF